MSEGQKIIKYCAIAFAALLAIGIISGIASVIFSVVSVVSGGTAWIENEKATDYSKTFTGVESLDIDHSIGKLNIKVGDEFKVEAEDVSKKFDARVDNSGKLIVSENQKGAHFLWFDFNHSMHLNSKITIYLPSDFIAKEVKLETGAGNVSIDALKTDYLGMSAGAGNVNGNNIVASDAVIEGGVGEVKLDNVNFKEADFDCGVGNIDLEGIVSGNTKVDCGVGNVDFNLNGNVNDYDFDIDSGIGTIRVNGEKVSELSNNFAANLIKIDGGIGNVNIDFAQ